MVTFKDTAELIREQDIKKFLESRGYKIPRRGNFTCPVCGKGENSPCASIKNNRVKCFSTKGCGGLYSVLDLIAYENGIKAEGADYFKAVRIGAQMFGLPIPDETSGENQNQPKIERKQPQTLKEEASSVDYTAYLKQCGARLTAPESIAYLEKRGLSLDVCKRFGVGFDPSANGFPKLIIPCERGYFARAILDEDKVQKKNSTGGNGFFNVQALSSSEPLFIVEGAIDALSIESLGYPALGLGSTANFREFANKCEAVKKAQGKIPFFLLALDRDEAGEKATQLLKQELSKRGGIRFRNVSQAIYGGCKDANECLCEEQGAFKEAIEGAYSNRLTDKQIQEREDYLARTQGSRCVSELDAIYRREGTFFPTGFKSLDKLLDGGLYTGLCVIGAISSLGKTALALQIADNVASAGKDVLIFSLEMARTELVGRSVSRISFKKACDSPYKVRDVAWSYRQITSAVKRSFHSTKESEELLASSIDDYRHGAGEHIFIIEGSGDVKVTRGEEDIDRGIRQMIEEHIEKTGRKPLVIIDYMQLLTPMSERASDKQNMDRAVLELKRITRDKEISIIAISSFNRGSYSSGATMSAFKESGAIEYTADVLIGLSFKRADDDTKELSAKEYQIVENNCKSETDGTGEIRRLISLTILKNRNGETGKKVCFDYYPKYSYFNENEEENKKLGLIK